MEKKILISTSISDFNNKLLKHLRLSRPYSEKSRFRRHMSKTQVANKIGVTSSQIGRYETDEGKPFKNLPRFKVFKLLCLLFQIDPKELLGLAWIGSKLVTNDEISLTPKRNWIVPIQFCPKCGQLIYNSGKTKEIYERDLEQDAKEAKE